MRYGPLSYHRPGRVGPRDQLREPFPEPRKRRDWRLTALFPPRPRPTNIAGRVRIVVLDDQGKPQGVMKLEVLG